MHLKYFAVQGAAETLRYVLVLGDCPWTETGWSIDFSKFPKPGLPDASPGFAAAKDNGELDVNLGRAPVVIIDGKTALGQSKPIEQYLARRLGIMGSSEIEAAQIGAVVEHVRDLKDKYQKAKGDKDTKAKFFAADMPEFMGKIEKSLPPTVGSSGALIGKKLSYADVTFYVFVKDFFTDKEAALGSIKACPRLAASIEAVDKHPRIIKYRAERTNMAT